MRHDSKRVSSLAGMRLRHLIAENQRDILNPWFRGVLRSMAAASLTGSLALAGCSNSHSTVITDSDASVVITDDGSVMPRPDADTPRPDAGIGTDSGIEVDAGPEVIMCPANDAVLARALTRAGLDSMTLFLPSGGFSPQAFSASHTIGEPCTSASDEACQAEHDELHAQMTAFMFDAELPAGITYAPTLLVSDAAGARLEQDFSSLLGGVDHHQDAAFLLLARGENFFCGDATMEAEFTVNPDGSYTIRTYNTDVCAVGYRVFQVDADGTVTVVDSGMVDDTPPCAVGRRVAGMTVERSSDLPAVADFFSRVAQLEAAAVVAFDCVAEELAHHGAPADLIADTRTAQADEVRHAELTVDLARRFGGQKLGMQAERFAPRPMFELAADNAVEGCVRETYGALVAHHQAATASDPAVAELMREIAADESNHAALSWRIAHWAESKLSEDERDQIAAMRRQALEELRAETRANPGHPDLVGVAGLPSVEAAESMLLQLETLIASM